MEMVMGATVTDDRIEPGIRGTADDKSIEADILGAMRDDRTETAMRGTMNVEAKVPARAASLAPAPEAMAARTRLLLEGPVALTLARLAAPNVAVMMLQAAVTTLDGVFVGWLGKEALAGISLVFPLVMLMQTMSAGGMGGGVASAIARALGAGRRADADALAIHAMLIAGFMAALFTGCFVLGGPAIYRAMGGHDGALESAVAYSTVVFGGAIVYWLFNTLGSIVRGSGNMTLPAAVMTMVSALYLCVAPGLV